MQLVFTELGLSLVNKTPSTQLPISPAQPQTTSLSINPFSLQKVDSPRSHQQASMKTNILTPKLRRRCNCKQSRCLKLYCECFAAGEYCEGCGCNCCRNNVENEALRQAAMEHILDRKPNAFRPKIACSPSGAQDDANIPTVGKHNWGCRCKKTECLKNYCECFHAEMFCSKNCKCMDCKNSEEYVKKVALSGSHYNNSKICNDSEGYEKSMVVSGGDNNKNISKNFEGPEDRKAIAKEDPGEANLYKYVAGCQEEVAFSSWEDYFRKICIKQANAAISAAVGLPGPSILQASRKRKLLEFLDKNDKDPPIQRLTNHQKVNPCSVSSSLSALFVDPIDDVDGSAILGSSEFHCSSKSSYTYIIQAREMEELCSILVLVAESARKFSGKDCTSDIQAARGNQTEVQDLENYQEGPNVHKETSDDHMNGNEAASMNKDGFIFKGIDSNEGSHSSPGKIGLMSSEIDELFTEASKRGQIPIHGYNEDVYVEQERLVLTSFSDCLKKIALGNIKGQFQPVENPIVKDVTAT